MREEEDEGVEQVHSPMMLVCLVCAVLYSMTILSSSFVVLSYTKPLANPLWSVVLLGRFPLLAMVLALRHLTATHLSSPCGRNTPPIGTRLPPTLIESKQEPGIW